MTNPAPESQHRREFEHGITVGLYVDVIMFHQQI